MALRPLLLLVVAALPLFAVAGTVGRDLIERYTTDRDALRRFYDLPLSAASLERQGAFLREWKATLDKLDFGKLDVEDRIDALLLANEVDYGLKRVGVQAAKNAEIASLLPFAQTVLGLELDRRNLEPVDPQKAADKVAKLSEEVKALAKRVEAGLDAKPGADALTTTPVLALRAADALGGLRSALDKWFKHYDGYRPDFGWWVRTPFAGAAKELEAYEKLLREKVAGQKGEPDDPLVGDPLGRDALLVDMAHELIPYSPEELVQIAEKEYAWCLAEAKKAAKEMGFGEDWKAALEKVKADHVEPGKQDELVIGLAREAIDFVDKHDLVTVEPLCRETWRVDMLSQREQQNLPFAAYGGQKMLVSFPLESMDNETKLMSMRGNNVHFTRAITHHELIPGHHLQGYMASRYRPYREALGTPFLVEGWALHWEMLLWDLGFAKSPEDRLGMLFWRMHRCARIVVSLNFHLGKMKPAEMIDYLVDRVGHERFTATSEVRRFIGGNYSPLYQCAYMIGGLQIRAMYRELVGGKKMTPRQFHDAILHENEMPIVLIRAALMDEKLPKDFKPTWRFDADSR
ncbi:MAG: DUF885 family protein [Fimbriimonadales bacterium]